MKANRIPHQHIKLTPVEWELAVNTLEKEARRMNRMAKTTRLAWARARFEVLADEYNRIARDIAGQLH